MKLITTPEYILLVDETSLIARGDYRIMYIDGIAHIEQFTSDEVASPRELQENGDFKIIAYYPIKYGKFDLPYAPLLPSPFKKLSIDLNGLASDNIKHDGIDTKHPLEARIRSNMWKDGYEFAQKSNQKFTLEDMQAFGKKCFYKGFEKSENDDANCFTAWRESASELITTIFPKDFKPEYEVKGYSMGQEHWVDEDFAIGHLTDVEDGNIEHYAIPEVHEKRMKTIINSDWLKELVGTYIY